MNTESIKQFQKPKQQNLKRSYLDSKTCKRFQGNDIALVHRGKRISDIARDMNTTRPLVERCIDKAIGYGIMDALNDFPRSGRKPSITDDAKAWVINLACTAPRDLGFAAETWTYSMLVKYILQHAEAHEHKCLMRMRTVA